MDIASVIQAIRNRFGSKPQPSVDQRAASAKQGAERIASSLPAMVMPHNAIMMKRKQMADLDAQTKDE